MRQKKIELEISEEERVRMDVEDALNSEGVLFPALPPSSRKLDGLYRDRGDGGSEHH